ncbi:MAG: transcription termination factor Rho [Chthoniobacteraceae bacterium]|jgi:transcription termination factor Rho
MPSELPAGGEQAALPVSPPAEAAPAQERAALSPRVHLDELHALHAAALIQRMQELRIRVHPDRSRNQLVADMIRFLAERGSEVIVDGVLEMASESHGFLRWPRFNFRPGPEDIYVPSPVVRRFGLQSGHRIVGRLRMARDREKFLALDQVHTIEGIASEAWTSPKPFDSLTATFPNERIILENPLNRSILVRAVDLITPLGRGQRALIVAPPRTGKTILLKEIAQAIRANTPEVHVIMLLVDERPEEVTDLRRAVDADIYSSTFDESPGRHIQVAELVSERARRLVELGRHVVILLDSITRLARGYNALQPGKGRTMSGGIDSKALAKPKKFFSSARNVEEGGSLTIVATALIDTESRMDQLIFEEFKGTGNMELQLDRGLAEQRIFPAIHILNSGTRREDLLYHPEEFERVTLLRRKLAELPSVEAMEVFLANLKATRTNAELLLTGLREVKP